MKTRLACSFFAAVLVLASGPADISADRYLNDVRYLASPELKGRGSGQPGLEKAARYIERQFAAAGLKPVPDHGYFQPFPVTTDAHMGPGNRMEVSESGRRSALKLKQEFVPFNFSAIGRMSGTVVFAGYGITAPEYHYDDYAGIDATGKIVLVLRHEPQEFDEHSVFAGKALTAHAQFWSKAVNAKRHGALAVVIVNDQPNHPARRDLLEEFGHTAGPTDAGVGFLQVTDAVAGTWLAAAGKRLDALVAGIDKELKPQSFALPASVTITAVVDLKRDTRTVRNVAGYLPGRTDEYVVIGAHYDHLGLGGPASLAPAEIGKTHPGADDNASGTAGVLELARWFGSRPKHRRGILFLCFAGEELGLLGSRYWVDHPELSLGKATAMINLDMIGRIRDHKVYVGDARSGTSFRPMLEQALPAHGIRMDFSGLGSDAGSSDDTSFISKQVPSLFFFSGLHADYHKPSDTWDKINAPDAASLLAAVQEIATRLADDPGRPEFVRAEPAKPGPVAGEGASGYGAWFGSVPDFGETEKGVKFADVTAGSPAAMAGLRAGDTLVEFDGKPVANLYDFTYALRAHKPGDQVAVKVLRGPETVETKVTLRERPR